MIDIYGNDFGIKIDSKTDTLEGHLGNWSDAGWFWEFDKGHIYLALYRLATSRVWDEFMGRFSREAQDNPDEFQYLLDYLKNPDGQEMKNLVYGLTGDNQEYNRSGYGYLDIMEEDAMSQIDEYYSDFSVYASELDMPKDIFQLLLNMGIIEVSYIDYAEDQKAYLDKNYKYFTPLEDVIDILYDSIKQLDSTLMTTSDISEDISEADLEWRGGYFANYSSPVFDFSDSEFRDIDWGSLNNNAVFSEVIGLLMENNIDDPTVLKPFIQYIKNGTIAFSDVDFQKWLSTQDYSEEVKEKWLQTFVRYMYEGPSLFEHQKRMHQKLMESKQTPYLIVKRNEDKIELKKGGSGKFTYDDFIDALYYDDALEEFTPNTEDSTLTHMIDDITYSSDRNFEIIMNMLNNGDRVILTREEEEDEDI